MHSLIQWPLHFEVKAVSVPYPGGGTQGAQAPTPPPYDIGANYLFSKNIQQFNHEVHMKIAVLLVPHVLNIDQHNRRG